MSPTDQASPSRAGAQTDRSRVAGADRPGVGDTSGESLPERHLFIAGCPRSGTSALAFMLNEHPQIVLGFERFKRVRAQLDPFHFTPAQFFAPAAAETDIRGELLYERLRERWARGTVTVIGDKVPLYTRVLPQLLERFPRGRMVVMVRDLEDVAASFRRRAADPQDWWPAENDHRLAVQMWNEALAAAREAERFGEGERIFLLPYEPLLAGEERWLDALLAFVGLPPTERLRAEHRRLAAEWRARGAARFGDGAEGDAGRGGVVEGGVGKGDTGRGGVVEGGLGKGDASRGDGNEDDRGRIGDGGQLGQTELRAYIETHRDHELLTWARACMERQLEQVSLPPAVGRETEEEVPLVERELSERAREHRQLLEQMRSPGERAPGEVETLERRLLAAAGELVLRQERLRQLARSARPAPADTLARPVPRGARAEERARVTFLMPHQRPTTGGVYVIEQFARHLAAHLAVSVVVREGVPRPLAGVEVRAAQRLDAEALPAADVLVYPADMRDAALIFDLPADRGRPVMFFQGYGTPGSPVVEANLSAAASAVAVAHWLVEVALGHGVPCAHVPEGLDREVFAPGRPARERPPRVSLMTHRLDWKGLSDALEALALVRAARSDVEIVLFGTERVEGVEGVGSFLDSPSRPEVAAVLRSSSVHVVASWEEGFGLTGAEAIACGAALATTDTKGSRDYAFDGQTALVSAPRDPRALARNVLTLLEDADLRARLVSTGRRQLQTVMPPWPEAARRMEFALLER
jgi:glycosyltransferase involved in cell wall biosynthesis